MGILFHFLPRALSSSIIFSFSFLCCQNPRESVHPHVWSHFGYQEGLVSWISYKIQFVCWHPNFHDFSQLFFQSSNIPLPHNTSSASLRICLQSNYFHKFQYTLYSHGTQSSSFSLKLMGLMALHNMLTTNNNL